VHYKDYTHTYIDYIDYKEEREEREEDRLKRALRRVHHLMDYKTHKQAFNNRSYIM
jgi:hypothetical protein